MFFIRLENSDSTEKFVEFVHFIPSELPVDVLKEGIVLDIDFPRPELYDGKEPRLYYNIETETLFYKYVDRPLTIEEQLQLERNKGLDLGQRLFDLETMLIMNGVI